jgi:ABC-2 type transport system ATP-binding protein
MTADGTAAISVGGLTKRFGEVAALDGIDFDVREGEVFGLLGPNGAGKTTTINILTGLARADAGEVRIAGVDTTRRPRAAQRLFGVVPDESNLWPELTGRENLAFCGALYGMPRREREARARELLGTFGLADAADRRFAGYSRGMKRKLAIAAGIIHAPAILFLDEPTTGLDVASARGVRELVRGLSASGTTVFLTTHYIEEAERLCDRIAFVVSGRIARVAALDELMAEAQGRYAVEFALDAAPEGLAADAAKAFPGVECERAGPSLLRVASAGPVRIGPVVRWLEDRGLEVGEARKVRPSLEDVFVRVTGIAAAAMRQERERGTVHP